MYKPTPSKEEILEQYIRCSVDPFYAIETFFKVDDKLKHGLVPFKLFPKQKEVIYNYENNIDNIVVKSRQLGVSTITAAYFAVKYSLADINNPLTLVILANKERTATKLLKLIRGFVLQMPRYVWGDEYYGTPDKEKKKLFLVDNNTQLVLPNESQVIALATSPDAFRSASPTDLCIDECAFIDKEGPETYSAGMASLGATNGKSYLLSTANGYDDVFYETYAQSLAGENDYKITKMLWYEDPRYNTDLQWIKKGDNGENIIEDEKEFNFDGFEKRIKDGWKPTSSWYRKMCRKMNNNTQKISQELDVSFIGSGNNAIDQEHIDYYQNKAEKGDIDIKRQECYKWANPVEGHKYITIVDVSRGDSDDFSTVVIIDATIVEIVLEYKGKIAPDKLGEIAVEYSTPYNSYIIVDITGGYGSATIIKIIDSGYKNVHYSTVLDNPILDEKRLKKYLREGANGQKSVPGFIISSNRPIIVDTFLEHIADHSLISKSQRLVNEMKTLVNDGIRIQHKKRHNDDLVMSCAIGLYVMQYSLKSIEKVQEQTKAMLNSWVSANSMDSRKDVETNHTQPIKKPKFSPLVSRNMQDPNGEYLWLWGYIPKEK